MSLKFNPITAKFDVVKGSTSLKEYSNEDPASPKTGEVWVKRTDPVADGAEGEPRGLLLCLTYAGETGISTYDLSFYTEDDTIRRVTIS